MSPRIALADFMFRGRDKHRWALQRLQELSSLGYRNDAAQTEFIRLCKKLLKTDYHYLASRSESDVSLQKTARNDVALRALKADLLELYDEASGLIGKDMSPECFYQLGSMLGRQESVMQQR